VEETGFVRIPFPSRKIYRYVESNPPFHFTARGRYMLSRHRERVARNAIYGPRMEQMAKAMTGEIGRIDEFRFIISAVIAERKP
jgi:hypothetical protein